MRSNTVGSYSSRQSFFALWRVSETESRLDQLQFHQAEGPSIVDEIHSRKEEGRRAAHAKEFRRSPQDLLRQVYLLAGRDDRVLSLAVGLTAQHGSLAKGMRLLSGDEHQGVFTGLPHSVNIGLNHHFAPTRPGIEMCLGPACRKGCCIDEERGIGIGRDRRLDDRRRPPPLSKEIGEGQRCALWEPDCWNGGDALSRQDLQVALMGISAQDFHWIEQGRHIRYVFRPGKEAFPVTVIIPARADHTDGSLGQVFPVDCPVIPHSGLHVYTPLQQRLSQQLIVRFTRRLRGRVIVLCSSD